MSKSSPATPRAIEPGEVFVSPSPGSKPDRVQRVERIIETFRSIANDERGNLIAFIDEDHGAAGKLAQATVTELLKLFPE